MSSGAEAPLAAIRTRPVPSASTSTSAPTSTATAASTTACTSACTSASTSTAAATASLHLHGRSPCLGPVVGPLLVTPLVGVRRATPPASRIPGEDEIITTRARPISRLRIRVHRQSGHLLRGHATLLVRYLLASNSIRVETAAAPASLVPRELVVTALWAVPVPRLHGEVDGHGSRIGRATLLAMRVPGEL